MPFVPEQKESRMRRIVRDTLAIDPLISERALQEIVIQKINHPIDRAYLRKLIRKVNGEVAIVADREKVETRIAQLRENNRLLREALLKIAYPTPQMLVKHSDQLRAIEIIAKIEHTQAKLEMDFGLFTRHLGQIDIDHRMHPLDDLTRANIIGAFGSWNIIMPLMRKIEPVQVLIKEPEKIPHAPAITPTTPISATSGQIPAITGAGLVLSE